MIDMLKRHEIQVLRKAGHAQIDVAKLAGVSLGSVRRVEREPDVTQIETELPCAIGDSKLPPNAMKWAVQLLYYASTICIRA